MVGSHMHLGRSLEIVCCGARKETQSAMYCECNAVFPSWCNLGARNTSVAMSAEGVLFCNDSDPVVINFFFS